MIRIADTGNTSIQITTGGTEDRWTVYPYYKPDPSLQNFTSEKKSKIKELSIIGFRDKEDLSGHKMNKDLADAIAEIKNKLNQFQYADLGISVDEIDIDPKGEIANVLKTEHNINPIETESQTISEVKR